MISLKIALLICFSHWVADFVCQTDWMAQNKSKTNYPLFIHICVYTLVMIPFAVYALSGFTTIVLFLILNAVAHFVTDFYTSRVNSRLYAAGKFGSNKIPNLGFYSSIGFDQFLHYTALFGTYVMLSS